jgi:hypothetical protein
MRNLNKSAAVSGHQSSSNLYNSYFTEHEKQTKVIQPEIVIEEEKNKKFVENYKKHFRMMKDRLKQFSEQNKGLREELKEIDVEQMNNVSKTMIKAKNNQEEDSLPFSSMTRSNASPFSHQEKLSKIAYMESVVRQKMRNAGVEQEVIYGVSKTDTSFPKKDEIEAYRLANNRHAKVFSHNDDVENYASAPMISFRENKQPLDIGLERVNVPPNTFHASQPFNGLQTDSYSLISEYSRKNSQGAIQSAKPESAKTTNITINLSRIMSQQHLQPQSTKPAGSCAMISSSSAQQMSNLTSPKEGSSRLNLQRAYDELQTKIIERQKYKRDHSIVSKSNNITPALSRNNSFTKPSTPSLVPQLQLSKQITPASVRIDCHGGSMQGKSLAQIFNEKAPLRSQREQSIGKEEKLQTLKPNSRSFRSKTPQELHEIRKNMRKPSSMLRENLGSRNRCQTKSLGKIEGFNFKNCLPISENSDERMRLGTPKFPTDRSTPALHITDASGCYPTTGAFPAPNQSFEVRSPQDRPIEASFKRKQPEPLKHNLPAANTGGSNARRDRTPRAESHRVESSTLQKNSSVKKSPNTSRSPGVMQRLAAGEKATVSKEEMYAINKRMYNELPEVREREKAKLSKLQIYERVRKIKDYDEVELVYQ